MPDVEAAVTALCSKTNEVYPDKVNPYINWQSGGLWKKGDFCDSFAQWGMVEIGKFAWPETSQFGYKGAAYVPFTVKDSKIMGVWFEPGLIPVARGWQVVFSWNQNGTADHIETIVEVVGDGTFITIGGNTGGGRITYNHRDLTYIMGFIKFDDTVLVHVPVPPPANYAAPSNPSLCWLVTSPLMAGPDIHWMQAFENECCGQSLRVDGIYGNLTRASVVNFQRFFGLTIDGVVGPETYDCMRYIAALNGFPS